MLVAQSGDELFIGGLIARSGEDAQMGFTAIQRLDSFAETTSKTVMEHGDLQDLLQSGLRVEGCLVRLLLNNLGGDVTVRKGNKIGRLMRTRTRGRRTEKRSTTRGKRAQETYTSSSLSDILTIEYPHG